MTKPKPRLTDLDLRVISLALQTQIRVHTERAGDDSPPVIAARKALTKVEALRKATK